jgi:hypothetical protein
MTDVLQSDIRFAWARTIADYPADPNKRFGGVILVGRRGQHLPPPRRVMRYHKAVEQKDTDENVLAKLRQYLSGMKSRPRTDPRMAKIFGT